MCRECNSNPCNSRCPNASESYTCSICEDEIKGGVFASINGIEYICESCLWDINGLDLAERLGIMDIM